MSPSGRLPRRAVLRTFAFAGAAVAVSALLTGCGRSVASEPTVLEQAVSAYVLSGHTTTVGYAGMRLRHGDVVTTGAGGSARLVTAGRAALLGADAVLAITDGARQQLRRGSLVLDTRRGPGLTVTASGFTVHVGRGTAARIDRGYTLRVATFEGRAAEVRSGAGRALDVPRWHQVVSSGDALPDTSAPLHLLDDPAEEAVAPALVSDDRQLIAEARGLDSGGHQVLQVVDASFRGDAASLPPGSGPSEAVLPLAIAKATGKALSAEYRIAVGLRRQGGSWAVVARIAGVDAAGALRALAALQPGTGTPAQTVAALQRLAQAIATTAPGSGSGSGPGGGGGTAGGGGTGGGSGGSGGGSGGTPTPTPSPSDLVGQVVTSVTGLVTSASPTPSSSPSPTASAAPLLPIQPIQPTSLTSLLPQPIVSTVTGLLGG